MTTYQLPPEPDGPLWDKAGSKWVRVKENLWYGGIQDMYRVWGDVVHYYGPLTTTPPIKEGDTGLTAEQGGDFNLIVSSGVAATQSIPHIHVHYVPRADGDGLMLPWHTEAHDAKLREQIAREILDERPPATTEPSLREYITGLRSGHVMAANIARGKEQA